MTTASTLQLTGEMIIGGEAVLGTAGDVRAVDPATGAALEPAFGLADEAQTELAATLASAAFDAYRATAPEDRARFLERAADNIEALGDELVERAVAETGLPEARIRGERARTTGQLRLFAAVLREGSWQGARIDPALPDRQPTPRADIRQRKVPLGPVLVFGASNFPLAFSTAGGDTASALAAGCPVIVKAHNAHPGTSILVGRAVAQAAEESGLPRGTFSVILGRGNSVGQTLAAHPAIKAVAFTGSRAGGLALAATAAARREPIPVYAEMSSTNPVVLLPGALAAGAHDVAAGFVGSLTQHAGQYCTNPGLTFVPEGAAGDAFVTAAAAELAAQRGQTMLTAGISAAYTAGSERLEGEAGVDVVARGTGGDGPNAPAPLLAATSPEAFDANPRLAEEVFGSTGLLVRYADTEQLTRLLEGLEGQLTATVQLDASDAADLAAARGLLPVLERKVGRILFNGWPTGVEVGHAMVHGGPFPATSDSRTTSVGSLAIERFLRPVAYQNVPEALLPEALRDANPLGIPRRIDGELQLPAPAEVTPPHAEITPEDPAA
ncbi:aldehyde dehydrogenase (NADP(+)) [Sinomonas sp. ASV486]|uniref:aldehyde dehydrogenase (NADP(+)) n=1 Tax=Sinomonas sp. ASV486 TaxID=3051170 RepID=UPI0027DCAFB2|nr:aldehyde dehydrogenase (NADP(+)) [Sinomonas sp. ASV486]MDQ4488870.1 aldehyde dehydrogenase (NADP(+)) [Sinomonas sp. ASV486]